MKTNFIRLFLACLLALFFVGSCPVSFDRPAEAKTKKVVRKVKKVKRAKKKKKVVRRVKKSRRIVRKPRKVSLSARKKVSRARTAVKKAPAAKSGYALPSRSGSVTQSYTIEEGVGGDEVENLISELKSVGADEVAVDSATNTVTVTFHTSRLTSVGIVKKLKNIGYTAKRAY